MQKAIINDHFLVHETYLTSTKKVTYQSCGSGFKVILIHLLLHFVCLMVKNNNQSRETQDLLNFS